MVFEWICTVTRYVQVKSVKVKYAADWYYISKSLLNHLCNTQQCWPKMKAESNGGFLDCEKKHMFVCYYYSIQIL